MRIMRTLMLASLVLSVWQCSRPRGKVELQVHEPGETISFRIESPKLREPLELRDRAFRSIFFEENGERVYIQGEPDWKEARGGVTAAWDAIKSRRIEVRFEPEGQHYRLQVRAMPDSGITGWGFNLAAGVEEYFTGVMERVVDGLQRESWRPGITTALNLRGQMVEVLIKPTLSLYAPFFLSSRGYGLFVHGTWPGRFDFCKSDSAFVEIAFEGPTLTASIYTGPDPMTIVQRHTLDTGPPFVPPKWAFTPWRWRDDHDNRPQFYDSTPVTAPFNSMVVEDILLMQHFKIPCGVYWVDRPWAVGPYGYSDFKWDPQRLPEAPEMIRWIHEKGMKFVLWIAPWVMGDMAQEAIAKGYTLPGQTSRAQERPLIDFTNPQARRWWQENGVRKVLEDGVDGFKMDRAEEMVPAARDVFGHDGRSTREIRNDYPRQYIAAAYEIASVHRGEDFVLMPRAGYSGSAKYGIFWGGDIHGTQWGLRAAIIAAQKAAIMGYPIWGSDTGGYWGGFSREVTARWLAFSCFTPIMEVGPTENRAFWDMPEAPNYDTELIAIWRLYATVHSRLADYSYRHAQEAAASGTPIIRPLFLAFPDQPEAWKNWQTYLYGEDILVSPIWKSGQQEQNVYLPAGHTWLDAWDRSRRYEGGQTITAAAPLEKIPIFVREGAKVDLGNLKALYQESLALARRKPDLAQLQRDEFASHP